MVSGFRPIIAGLLTGALLAGACLGVASAQVRRERPPIGAPENGVFTENTLESSTAAAVPDANAAAGDRYSTGQSDREAEDRYAVGQAAGRGAAAGTSDIATPQDAGDDPLSRGSEDITASRQEPGRDLSDAQIDDAIRGSLDEVDTDIEVGTVKVRRANEEAEEDPWAALGIRSGSFLWFPAIELRGGVTDNGTKTARGGRAGFYEIAPELVGRSDWSRHQLEVDLRGTFRDYVDGIDTTEPTASGSVKGRIDVSERTTGNIEANYALSRESNTDPDVSGTTGDGPLIHSLGASAAVTQRFNRISVAPKGALERTIYESSGAAAASRNTTTLTGSLRLSYDDGGAIKPYVEGLASRRLYDEPIDDNGQKRTGQGMELRGGVAFDHEGVLTGEVGVGYRREQFDDPALADLDGWTLNGNLDWTASALTKVTLSANTDFSPSTVRNSSGSVKRTVGARITHAFRRNIIADAGASFGFEDFDDTGRSDRTIDADLGLTYKLNRTVAMTARGRHEQLQTTVPGEDYTANSFTLGLRLQR